MPRLPSASPLAPPQSKPPSGRFIFGALLLVLVALTVCIYWPGTHGGYVLDDYANIVGNSAVHVRSLTLPNLLGAAFSTQSGPLDRPLSLVSFALNEYFWGPAPYSMKVTNIIIHCVNGLLVYAVAIQLLLAYRRQREEVLSENTARWTALAVTAAWLLLPINLTSVLYVVQRMTSLSGTFVLAAVALYLSGRVRMLDERPGLWMIWAGTVVFGGLAVLAKESGALLPVYLLVIEGTLFRFARADGTRDRRLYIFFLLTLLVPGLAGLAWQLPHIPGLFAHTSRPFTLAQRLLTEPRVVVDYIAWSLAPTLGTLSLYHDNFPLSKSLLNPPSTLLAILVILLLLGLAVTQRRKRPLLSFGIFWFFAGQLLTATVFNLELVFEHRNYLPSLGLVLALFSIILLEPPTRLIKARASLVVGLIVMYALITFIRAETWANPIRYSVIEAAAHPESPRATYELGRTYLVLAKTPHSPFFPLAVKALEHAMIVPGSSILPEQGLLWLYARFHKPIPAVWWQSADRKLARARVSAQDKNALASLVNCQLAGECDFPKPQMMKLLHTALNNNPDNPEVITIDANYVLNVLREPEQARALMLLTIKKAPKVAQYRVNLIKLDIALHHFDTASREISSLQMLNHVGALDDTVEQMRNRLAEAKAHASASSLPAGSRTETTTRPGGH